MPRRLQSGFTLLELSVTLAVFSLLIAGILAVMTQDTRRTKQADLNAKLDAIEKALKNYRKYKGRMPCPADATLLITSGNFGIEGATVGTCTGSTPAANFTDGSNTVGGMVPTRTLGLPDETAFDPWGGRLTYAIDKRITADDAFTTYPPDSGIIGSMTVNDATGTARTTHALIVVVSHGPNGHGAFQLSGARKSFGSTNTDEKKNCHCNSDGTNDTFDAIFAQHSGTSNGGDILDNFDDTVRYYMRSQFLYGDDLLPE